MCKINVYKYLQKDFPSTVHDIEKNNNLRSMCLNMDTAYKQNCVYSHQGEKRIIQRRVNGWARGLL